MQTGEAQDDTRLKAFLGDLVMGIHAETVSDTKLESTDYKEEPTGIDKYLGAQEYAKLLNACKTLQMLVAIDTEAWQDKSNEKDLRYFKSAELEATEQRLVEAQRLLEIKIHNYRQLEKI